MRGAITPLPHYAFMAWCSVKRRDTLDRRLGGEERNSHPCPCLELNPDRPGRSLVSMLTDVQKRVEGKFYSVS